jgi:poly-gamma-glutamate capsule biosynthesis protein CapA/YwtB (metallophosphatase superfamily)
MNANSAPRGLVLWQSREARTVAARIAIAGDFLPAGKLDLPAGPVRWCEAAGRLAGHFEDADVSFVNLECAIEADGLPARPLAGLGDIVSAPAASLDYLNAIGAGIVSLANNHAYDFGAAGAARIRQALIAHGIVPLGAGGTLRTPPEVFLWRGPGDIRVGLWAAALASADLARGNSSGVEPASLGRARRAAEILRVRGAQFIIALLHCGCLRTNRPDPYDAARMDAIAREGFDIVAGSHSHRIAGARILPGPFDLTGITGRTGREGRPRFCAYGLGSIVSGFIAGPLEREGLVLVAALDASGAMVSLEVRPLRLAESGFGEVPAPEQARDILDRFQALSREISDGSAARLFYRDVSDGLAGLYARDIRAAFRGSGLRGLARKARRVRLRHIRRLVHRVTG